MFGLEKTEGNNQWFFGTFGKPKNSTKLNYLFSCCGFKGYVCTKVAVEKILSKEYKTYQCHGVSKWKKKDDVQILYRL